MPQKVVCSRCGYILYEGDALKSPQEIIRKHEGRCPGCNRKLCFSSDCVKVTAYDGEETAEG